MLEVKLHTQCHSPAWAWLCSHHVPPHTRGPVQPQGAGPSPAAMWGGMSLPGKQKAPPGTEHRRFHSNLKAPQLPPR